MASIGRPSVRRHENISALRYLVLRNVSRVTSHMREPRNRLGVAKSRFQSCPIFSHIERVTSKTIGLRISTLFSLTLSFIPWTSGQSCPDPDDICPCTSFLHSRGLPPGDDERNRLSLQRCRLVSEPHVSLPFSRSHRFPYL